jgi:hypothetical protein
MNFQVIYQFVVLALVVVSGPIIVGLLAIQEDNGL